MICKKLKNGLFSFRDENCRIDTELRVVLDGYELRSTEAEEMRISSHDMSGDIASETFLRYRYVRRDLSAEADYCITINNELHHAVVSAKFTNKGGSPVRISSIKLIAADSDGICLGGGIRDWSVFRNAAMSNDQTGVYRFGDSMHDINDVISDSGQDPASQTARDDSSINIGSNNFSILYSVSEGTSIMAGFITLDRQFGVIDLKCSPDQASLISYEASCQTDGIEVLPDESVESEKLMLIFGDPFRSISRYSKVTAESKNIRPGKETPTGWCSWYFFYESVTEEDVIRNLESISRNGLEAKYIQVDAGWEERFGDWHPNHKFPHGMKWLADRIHESGHKAGLWLSPFWIEPRSEIHREHPEWLLCGKEGDPLIFHCMVDGYIIDTTIYEAREWITRTFKRVTDEWGYDYVKIDFTRAVAMFPEARYKNKATRAEALRMGLEAVRAGTGPETFILGCGGHYGPSLGLIDASRTGDDISACWEMLAMTARQNILKYWMNAVWWVNDPDCILVRGPLEGSPGAATSYGRIQKGSFGIKEAKTAAALIRNTGGMVFSGDDLTQLEQSKLEIVKALFNHTGKAAVPRDMFKNRFPHILDVEISRGHHEVTVVNWTDKAIVEEQRICDLIGEGGSDSKYHVTEKYGSNRIGVYESNDPVMIGPVEPYGYVILDIVT